MRHATLKFGMPFWQFWSHFCVWQRRLSWRTRSDSNKNRWSKEWFNQWIGEWGASPFRWHKTSDHQQFFTFQLSLMGCPARDQETGVVMWLPAPAEVPSDLSLLYVCGYGQNDMSTYCPLTRLSMLIRSRSHMLTFFADATIIKYQFHYK